MNSKQHSLSRRSFLSRTAVLGGGLILQKNPRSAWSAQANEQVNLALIGVGGRGDWFVQTMPKLANIVALCDVNDQKIQGALKSWDDLSKKFASSPNDWERRAAESYKNAFGKNPKTYRDFRKMIDEMGSQIDAVVVATPDHTHAVAAAAAMHAGKHVFCEKPLTRTLSESRALRELARKQKVATAMGNQGTYSGPFRRALELIRNGTIGDITEVHVWNTGGGANKQQAPAGSQPAPAHLDWDLWLGPAAFRPFHGEWLNRNAWRDFGTCQLGNWASHSANLGFMSLKVHDLWLNPTAGTTGARLQVEAEHTGVNQISFPGWEKVQWHVPARGNLSPITIRWYNGDAPGARELRDKLNSGPGLKEMKGWEFAGTYIVGTKGAIHTTGHNMSFRLLPEDRFVDVQRAKPETVESSRDPEQDWLAACRGGKPAWSNFDYADALNEFLMLGNVATQFENGTKLDFDPVALKIVNNGQADRLLHAQYREGWKL